VKFPDENGAAHSARWDPARVLAECDAKQLMAEQLRRRFLLVGPDFSVPALQLARAFARAYRDHPDYRVWPPGTDGTITRAMPPMVNPEDTLPAARSPGEPNRGERSGYRPSFREPRQLLHLDQFC